MGESERRAAGAARLKHSVRIEVGPKATEDYRKNFTRDHFVRTVLKELLKQTPEEIIAVGSTGSPYAFEVSFKNQSLCDRFLELWRKEKVGGKLPGLILTPLFKRDFVPLVLRVYNPFLDKNYVDCLLKARCEDVRGGTKILDEGGFWTCKYRYAVLLKEDLNLPGGVVHLPSTFSLGSDRGLISYPGQPMECRRCGGFGHFRRDCRAKRCRFCHSDEHDSAECKAPKKCSMCGEAGHLFRMCPRVPFSYAQVVAGERGEDKEKQHGQDGGEHMEARLADPVPCGRDGAPDPPLQEQSGAAESVEARPLEGEGGSAEVGATDGVPGEATGARVDEGQEAADPGTSDDFSGELALSPGAQRAMERPPAVKDLPRLGPAVWSDADSAAEEEMVEMGDGVRCVELRALDAIDSVAKSADGGDLEDWQVEREKKEREVLEEAEKGLEAAKAGAAAVEAAAAVIEIREESGSEELYSSADDLEMSAEQDEGPSVSTASPLCSSEAEGLQRRARPAAAGRTRGRDRDRATGPEMRSRSRSRDSRLRDLSEDGQSV